MKAIVVLITLCSSIGFACPQLAGTYNCQVQETGDIGEVIIEQVKNEFLIRAEGTHVTLIADGKTKVDNGTDYITTYKVWCDSSGLNTNYDTRMANYRVVTNTLLKPLSNKNLKWNFHIVESGAYVSDVRETWNCTAK